MPRMSKGKDSIATFLVCHVLIEIIAQILVFNREKILFEDILLHVHLVNPPYKSDLSSVILTSHFFELFVFHAGSLADVLPARDFL